MISSGVRRCRNIVNNGDCCFTHRSKIECSICLDEIHSDRVVLNCTSTIKHIFHHECLKSWLEQGKETCPNCRSKIPLIQIIQIDPRFYIRRQQRNSNAPFELLVPGIAMFYIPRNGLSNNEILTRMASAIQQHIEQDG